MNIIQDIESRIFALPERERADLASRLLSSLPAFLTDPDEGITEALDRESSASRDLGDCLTLEQFTQGVQALRSR